MAGSRNEVPDSNAGGRGGESEGAGARLPVAARKSTRMCLLVDEERGAASDSKLDCTVHTIYRSPSFGSWMPESDSDTMSRYSLVPSAAQWTATAAASVTDEIQQMESRAAMMKLAYRNRLQDSTEPSFRGRASSPGGDVTGSSDGVRRRDVRMAEAPPPLRGEPELPGAAALPFADICEASVVRERAGRDASCGSDESVGLDRQPSLTDLRSLGSTSEGFDSSSGSPTSRRRSRGLQDFQWNVQRNCQGQSLIFTHDDIHRFGRHLASSSTFHELNSLPGYSAMDGSGNRESTGRPKSSNQPSNHYSQATFGRQAMDAESSPVDIEMWSNKIVELQQLSASLTQGISNFVRIAANADPQWTQSNYTNTNSVDHLCGQRDLMIDGSHRYRYLEHSGSFSNNFVGEHCACSTMRKAQGNHAQFYASSNNFFNHSADRQFYRDRYDVVPRRDVGMIPTMQHRDSRIHRPFRDRGPTEYHVGDSTRGLVAVASPTLGSRLTLEPNASIKRQAVEVSGDIGGYNDGFIPTTRRQCTGESGDFEPSATGVNSQTASSVEIVGLCSGNSTCKDNCICTTPASPTPYRNNLSTVTLFERIDTPLESCESESGAHIPVSSRAAQLHISNEISATSSETLEDSVYGERTARSEDVIGLERNRPTPSNTTLRQFKPRTHFPKDHVQTPCSEEVRTNIGSESLTGDLCCLQCTARSLQSDSESCTVCKSGVTIGKTDAEETNVEHCEGSRCSIPCMSKNSADSTNIPSVPSSSVTMREYINNNVPKNYTYDTTNNIKNQMPSGLTTSSRSSPSVSKLNNTCNDIGLHEKPVTDYGREGRNNSNQLTYTQAFHTAHDNISISNYPLNTLLSGHGIVRDHTEESQSISVGRKNKSEQSCLKAQTEDHSVVNTQMGNNFGENLLEQTISYNINKRGTNSEREKMLQFGSGANQWSHSDNCVVEAAATNASVFVPTELLANHDLNNNENLERRCSWISGSKNSDRREHTTEVHESSSASTFESTILFGSSTNKMSSGNRRPPSEVTESTDNISNCSSIADLLVPTNSYEDVSGRNNESTSGQMFIRRDVGYDARETLTRVKELIEKSGPSTVLRPEHDTDSPSSSCSLQWRRLDDWKEEKHCTPIRASTCARLEYQNVSMDEPTERGEAEATDGHQSHIRTVLKPKRESSKGARSRTCVAVRHFPNIPATGSVQRTAKTTNLRSSRAPSSYLEAVLTAPQTRMQHKNASVSSRNNPTVPEGWPTMKRRSNTVASCGVSCRMSTPSAAPVSTDLGLTGRTAFSSARGLTPSGGPARTALWSPRGSVPPCVTTTSAGTSPRGSAPSGVTRTAVTSPRGLGHPGVATRTSRSSPRETTPAHSKDALAADALLADAASLIRSKLDACDRKQGEQRRLHRGRLAASSPRLPIQSQNAVPSNPRSPRPGVSMRQQAITLNSPRRQPVEQDTWLQRQQRLQIQLQQRQQQLQQRQKHLQSQLESRQNRLHRCPLWQPRLNHQRQLPRVSPRLAEETKLPIWRQSCRSENLQSQFTTPPRHFLSMLSPAGAQASEVTSVDDELKAGEAPGNAALQLLKARLRAGGSSHRGIADTESLMRAEMASITEAAAKQEDSDIAEEDNQRPSSRHSIQAADNAEATVSGPEEPKSDCTKNTALIEESTTFQPVFIETNTAVTSLTTVKPSEENATHEESTNESVEYEQNSVVIFPNEAIQSSPSLSNACFVYRSAVSESFSDHSQCLVPQLLEGFHSEHWPKRTLSYLPLARLCESDEVELFREALLINKQNLFDMSIAELLPLSSTSNGIENESINEGEPQVQYSYPLFKEENEKQEEDRCSEQTSSISPAPCEQKDNSMNFCHLKTTDLSLEVPTQNPVELYPQSENLPEKDGPILRTSTDTETHSNYQINEDSQDVSLANSSSCDLSSQQHLLESVSQCLDCELQLDKGSDKFRKFAESTNAPERILQAEKESVCDSKVLKGEACVSAPHETSSSIHIGIGVSNHTISAGYAFISPVEIEKTSNYSETSKPACDACGDGHIISVSGCNSEIYQSLSSSASDETPDCRFVVDACFEKVSNDELTNDTLDISFLNDNQNSRSQILCCALSTKSSSSSLRVCNINYESGEETKSKQLTDIVGHGSEAKRCEVKDSESKIICSEQFLPHDNLQAREAVVTENCKLEEAIMESQNPLVDDVVGCSEQLLPNDNLQAIDAVVTENWKLDEAIMESQNTLVDDAVGCSEQLLPNDNLRAIEAVVTENWKLDEAIMESQNSLVDDAVGCSEQLLPNGNIQAIEAVVTENWKLEESIKESQNTLVDDAVVGVQNAKNSENVFSIPRELGNFNEEDDACSTVSGNMGCLTHVSSVSDLFSNVDVSFSDSDEYYSTPVITSPALSQNFSGNRSTDLTETYENCSEISSTEYTLKSFSDTKSTGDTEYSNAQGTRMSNAYDAVSETSTETDWESLSSEASVEKMKLEDKSDSSSVTSFNLETDATNMPKCQHGSAGNTTRKEINSIIYDFVFENFGTGGSTTAIESGTELKDFNLTQFVNESKITDKTDSIARPPAQENDVGEFCISSLTASCFSNNRTNVIHKVEHSTNVQNPESIKDNETGIVGKTVLYQGTNIGSNECEPLSIRKIFRSELDKDESTQTRSPMILKTLRNTTNANSNLKNDSAGEDLNVACDEDIALPKIVEKSSDENAEVDAIKSAYDNVFIAKESETNKNREEHLDDKEVLEDESKVEKSFSWETLSETSSSTDEDEATDVIDSSSSVDHHDRNRRSTCGGASHTVDEEDTDESTVELTPLENELQLHEALSEGSRDQLLLPTGRRVVAGGGGVVADTCSPEAFATTLETITELIEDDNEILRVSSETGLFEVAMTILLHEELSNQIREISPEVGRCNYQICGGPMLLFPPDGQEELSVTPTVSTVALPSHCQAPQEETIQFSRSLECLSAPHPQTSSAVASFSTPTPPRTPSPLTGSTQMPMVTWPSTRTSVRTPARDLSTTRQTPHSSPRTQFIAMLLTVFLGGAAYFTCPLLGPY